MPTPADLATLASRLSVRSSVERAVDGLDALHLAVLAEVAHTASDDGGASLDVIAARLVADDEAVGAALQRLLSLALIWGGAGRLHVVAAVQEAIDHPPPGLDLGEADHYSSEAQKRGAEPPPIDADRREPAELDRLGSTAVLQALRLVEALGQEWSQNPPNLLRAGGLAVRDLRRTARELNVDEATAATLIEVAVAAGLINATPGIEPVYLPTDDFDEWSANRTAERWARLAAAWLTMTRQPSLVLQRGDRDRTLTALSPDIERSTAPALRAQVLDVLAALPPGAAPTSRRDVLARLAWAAPRRAHVQRAFADAILTEADLLGITAAGGLTGYSRTLRAGSRQVAEQVLAGALPEPVEHFLVQPDLTVVVPGPPTAALARELAVLADLESSGGASVYRITEATVRRALDSGREAHALTEFLAGRSRTDIPQSLTYLITDAARRHGTLRAGPASTYVRCQDEALLDRVVADKANVSLELRRLAPTVAISSAPLSRLLGALRAAGYAPAAESPDGSVLTVVPDAPRAPARPERPYSTRLATDTVAHRLALVRRIRSGDTLTELSKRVQPIVQQVPGVTSASTMELLRTAIKENRRVLIGCAEQDGTTTRRTILPISMMGGILRGHDAESQALTSIPLHRVTGVAVLDEAL